MHKSVSQTIIESWLNNLIDSDIDKNTINLLKEASENDALADAKMLKKIITKIEGKYAKNQDN